MIYLLSQNEEHRGKNTVLNKAFYRSLGKTTFGKTGDHHRCRVETMS